MAPGCCNPNEDPFGFESSQCCSTKSLLKREGARCMSSMWCDDYYDLGRYDCVKALTMVKRQGGGVGTPASLD